MKPQLDPAALPGSAGLRVHNLCKSYHSGEQTISILNDLCLELQPGENAAIVGPSG